jgi:hypothetical protein
MRNLADELLFALADSLALPPSESPGRDDAAPVPRSDLHAGISEPGDPEGFGLHRLRIGRQSFAALHEQRCLILSTLPLR